MFLTYKFFEILAYLQSNWSAMLFNFHREKFHEADIGLFTCCQVSSAKQQEVELLVFVATVTYPSFN